MHIQCIPITIIIYCDGINFVFEVGGNFHLIRLDSTAELERQAATIELEQLKKRVAELEEKLQGKKKKGGLKFKVHCNTYFLNTWTI